MSRKIVVTGAAGFIGSHLCEALLARGNDVVGVDAFTDNYDARVKRRNLSGFENQENFSLIDKSINDIDLDDLLTDIDCVCHLAAQPGVRDSWNERFDDYIDANIRATHRLCEAARKRDIARFVYASSSSVYGETTRLPMNESHPTRPLSPYGVTKLSGEDLCLLYRENYGLPVVALRFFTVYGPRQRPDMAFHRFIRMALDGKAVPVYGNGTQTRDFTYIADIVDANLRAMDYSGEEAVFNVGGGTRITLNAALDILGDLLPGGLNVHYEERAKGDVTHTYADIGLAAGELGYKPMASIEEGLANEVEWVTSLLGELKDY
jgi:nucleoside-diphosphate-sugar epimerase